MLGHGTRIGAAQAVEDFTRGSDRSPARFFPACSVCSGSSGAAFRPQAKDAMTTYAELLTRSPAGMASTFTPPSSLAIRSSWSRRSLTRKTTSEAHW
jgi:hypothetical protein